MSKDQLKCQYIYTNTGKKGKKCNKIVKQQTTKNVFENGCYCPTHVQQRKLYNPNKTTVSRPKQVNTPPPKNLQVEIFNFDILSWDLQTNLTKDDVFGILSDYPRYYIIKLIKLGSIKIYPHIKIAKIN
jgi:hypothetical protein